MSGCTRQLYVLTVALLLVGLTACTAESDAAAAAGALDPDFFDLAAFVEQTAAALEGTALTKEVVVNGVTETRRVDSVDWRQELAPFAQSNIDRPALWDLYERVEAPTADPSTRLVAYTARDASLFTRSIRVLYRGDAVVNVDIDNRFESFVASTEQQLSWVPGRYTIRSVQRARLLDERTLRIEGTWPRRGD